jgi:hypothetical protein
MYVLNKTDSIQGKAGTNSAINVIISGERYSTNVYKNGWFLETNLLSTTNQTLIKSPPVSGEVDYVVIHTITLTNKTGSVVNGIYLNLNQSGIQTLFISNISIKANTTLIITKEGGAIEIPVKDSICNTYVSGGSGGALQIYNEVPVGVIDGVNTIFTTANNFTAGTTRVYENGQRLLKDVDYTESGVNEITLLYTIDSGVIFMDYEKV